MWTPFLDHELYKYRPWSHPASCGLPRLLWPNNFGKIPRNSSKEFLKKMNTPGKRKKKDTGHRCQAMESGRGMKKILLVQQKKHSWKTLMQQDWTAALPDGNGRGRVWKSWLPENDETERYTLICLNEKIFDWYIDGFENICMIQSIFMKTKQVKKKKGIGWLQKKKRKHTWCLTCINN